MRFLPAAMLLLLLSLVLHAAEPLPFQPGSTGLEYIDTSFENASPCWYEQAADGTIDVHLLYDQERGSPNRAAGHIHLLLQGKSGTKLTLEFKDLENVWNGVQTSVGPEIVSFVVSANDRTWTSVTKEKRDDARVLLKVELTGPKLYVARLEPYRLSDLDRFLEQIRPNPLVQISPIGKTVQGRPLEIVRVGDTEAPYRVFLRARAHPWEPGGNWVLEGLVRRLLASDPEAASFRQRYCLYLLPMANKDGVANGRTRFNLQGKDLNRDWSRPADPELAPENAALEKWLEAMIAAGAKPHLALELHNDGRGLLHLSRPPVPDLPRYLNRMATFEKLLRQNTWFTEGSTGGEFKNAGTLGEGWLLRYGIDAVVHELNSNWIAGLADFPNAKNWQTYGAGMAKVLYEYFGEVKP